MDHRLPIDFFRREDVVQISKDLLGMHVLTQFDGQLTSGRIVETEAYRGADDKACHAYGGRRTKRTEVMYYEAGHAYVYLCYGIHHLFNIVCSSEGIANVVLIRAVEPLDGIDVMLQRRAKSKLQRSLTAGPGALSKALGITTHFTGLNMFQPNSPIWLEYGTQKLANIIGQVFDRYPLKGVRTFFLLQHFKNFC